MRGSASSRQEDRVDVRNGERRRDDTIGAGAEAGREGRAGAEPLHDADPRDRLLRERRQLTELFLIDLGRRGVAPRVAPEADAEEGQRQKPQ